MIKTIEAKERSEKITSKKGKQYFTLVTTEDERFICYDMSLHSELAVGMGCVIDIVPSKNPDFSDSIQRVPEEKPNVSEGVGGMPAPQANPSEPAPQAVGMTTKELGDMIRTKQLMPIFGVEIGAELVGWYRSQILGTTRIPFDGAKLPKIKTEKEE